MKRERGLAQILCGFSQIGKSANILLLFLCVLFHGVTFSQDYNELYRQFEYPRSFRTYDSLMALRLPVLKLPESYRDSTLPSSLDNSTLKYFPGIQAQTNFFACQQFAAVEYTYAYEVNRLRNLDGKPKERRYPAHYTWNFENSAAQYKGVSFFYSFDVIREQGHPTTDLFGENITMKETGWMTGYDKYFSGMRNRLKKIWMIPIQTPEGILTVKHYLHDHLDGSADGGVVFFDASSYFLGTNFVQIPPGTPEAGKDLLTGFYPVAVHGMTIVGYNDSIRFDINQDGQYTTDVDINNDGRVDMKDREIGAFRVANSYGTWWSDLGFFYILYRAFALEYDSNNAQFAPISGVWNNCVFAVEPDTGYRPRLVMKATVSMDSREKIRLRAGISTDTSLALPEKTLGFPVFNYGGGDHYMQGFDSLPEFKDLELGLDVTPLLSETDPSKPVRLFLVVEDRDPILSGSGSVKSLSFISHPETGNPTEFVSQDANVPIKANDATFLSVIATPDFHKVEVTTDHLPPYDPPGPLTAQLEASDGSPPYTWMLERSFEKEVSSSAFTGINQHVITIPNTDVPIEKVILPFRFPFYGKSYDTVYVNMYGFIAFDGCQYPYPFLTDEEEMIRRIPCICPAFSMDFQLKPGASMWYEVNPGWAAFRWQLESKSYPSVTGFNFILKIRKNGEFEFIYGDMFSPDYHEITACGFSGGGGNGGNTWTCWDLVEMKDKSFRFRPFLLPEGISLSETGLLTVSESDTSQVYDIPVKVTDRENISNRRTFSVTSGLAISEELVSASGKVLRYGDPAFFRITLTNLSPESINGIVLVLRTADTSLVISDSLVHIASIQPGETVTTDSCFLFSLRYRLPDQYPVSIAISAGDSARRWNKSCFLRVSAPQLECSLPVIFDGDDGDLDPGEIADMTVTLTNPGSLDIINPVITLVPGDSLVTVLDGSPAAPGDLRALSARTLTFRLKASRNSAPGNESTLNLFVSGEGDTLRQLPVKVRTGQKFVAVIKLGSISASPADMCALLDSMDVTYDYLEELPDDFERYQCCFIILGITPGAHIISAPEADILTKYLLSGGKIYLEGYGTWYYQGDTRLHPYFKYTSNATPMYYFPEVFGIPGQITDSMAFRYVSAGNKAVFAIHPKPPAFPLFENGDSIPRCLQWAYDGEDYKTIGTVLEFHGLVDSLPPSEKYTLMKRYLDLFRVNYSGPYPLFHAEENTVCKLHPVLLYDDSYDNVATRSWEFPGGSPSQSSLQNPVVTYDTAGDYDIKLTVSDGSKSWSVLKKKYIHVDQCAGERPLLIANSKLKLWPNPAGDRFRVELPCPFREDLLLGIYGINGKKMFAAVIPENSGSTSFGVDCSGFPPGLYIVRVISERRILTGKLVVQR